VLPASEFVGVNVAVVSSLLKLTDPPAALPAESLTVNDTVLGTTGWENVAIGMAVTGLGDADEGRKVHREARTSPSRQRRANAPTRRGRASRVLVRELPLGRSATHTRKPGRPCHAEQDDLSAHT